MSICHLNLLFDLNKFFQNIWCRKTLKNIHKFIKVFINIFTNFFSSECRQKVFFWSFGFIVVDDMMMIMLLFTLVIVIFIIKCSKFNLVWTKKRRKLQKINLVCHLFCHMTCVTHFHVLQFFVVFYYYYLSCNFLRYFLLLWSLSSLFSSFRSGPVLGFLLFWFYVNKFCVKVLF